VARGPQSDFWCQGAFQAAVEILFEMVENQASGVIHNAKSSRKVSPLALTVFV
jgi:F-type H+-transporting ATPase subunit a